MTYNPIARWTVPGRASLATGKAKVEKKDAKRCRISACNYYLDKTRVAGLQEQVNIKL